MADVESTNDDLLEVNDLWSQSSVFARLQEQRWATNERLVNSRHLTSRKLGRSSLFIPKTAGYVRRKMADYVASFSGLDPITITHSITSTPLGAKVLQKVVNHYLNTKVNWTACIYNAAYDALVNEFAPTYVWWEVETAIQEVATIDEKGNQSIEKVEVVVDSYPVVESLPPENVRIDPSASWDNIDEARYIAFESYRDRAYAEQRADLGDWPEIPDDLYSNVEQYPYNPLQAERRSTSSPFQYQLDDEDNELLCIRTHFFWDEIDGMLQPVMMETLGDRMVLSPAAPLSYVCAEDGRHAWPIIVGHVYPKPHEQYAAALPELVQSLQIEVNAIRNQRRDNVALILNPEKIISADSGVDPSNMAFSFPGKVVVAQNPAGIAWNVPPDVTAAGYNEENVAVNDMDRLVSEGPARAGSPTQRKETATQAQIMAAGASAAVNLDLTIFASSWAEQVVRRIAILSTQAAPAELFDAAAKSLGMDPTVIDALGEASKGNFVYNVYSGSEQSDLNNAISNATNIIAIVQQVYGPNANYFPLMQKLLATGGFDPATIIPDPHAAMSGQPSPPNPGFADFGGMQPGSQPNVQPRAAVQGGMFSAGG